MRYFSLFSGIGGFELGIQRSGVESECVGYSEVDKYAEAIYRYRFPGHTGYGDATRIIPDRVPDFDLLVAGFPCQSFSIAGKRRGFQDARGTLFFEIVRLCNERRPRHILLENVRGLLGHGHGETFQEILGFLFDAGYILQWEVLNSRDYGVPQNRERVFIIGHIRGECRPKVFPIGESSETLENEIATIYCLDANYAKGPARASRSMIELEYIGAVVSPDSSKRIEGDGDKSREYREGQRVYDADGLASALTVNKGYYGQATGLYCIADSGSQSDRVYSSDGISPALIAYQTGGNKDPRIAESISGKIRRLTPTECERLQAFPGGWTGIGLMGDTETEISDTQRYKCLGNAVTVNVVAEVVRRLYIS